MRKKLTAVILAVLVFSLIAASAASLGTITTDQLGSSVEAVSSCDTDGVTVEYNTTYDAGPPTIYSVSSIDVSGINAACAGQTIEVTLADTNGVALGSVGSALLDASTTANVTFTGVDAELVYQIGIIISG